MTGMNAGDDIADGAIIAVDAIALENLLCMTYGALAKSYILSRAGGADLLDQCRHIFAYGGGQMAGVSAACALAAKVHFEKDDIDALGAQSQRRVEPRQAAADNGDIAAKLSV